MSERNGAPAQSRAVVNLYELLVTLGAGSRGDAQWDGMLGSRMKHASSVSTNGLACDVEQMIGTVACSNSRLLAQPTHLQPTEHSWSVAPAAVATSWLKFVVRMVRENIKCIPWKETLLQFS